MTDADVKRFLTEQDYFVRHILSGDFTATSLYAYLEDAMDCKVVPA
jgi:hypothetical protein